MTPLAPSAPRRTSVPARLAVALACVAIAAGCRSTAAAAADVNEREDWYAFVDGDLRFGSQRVARIPRPDGTLVYELATRVLLEPFGAREQELRIEGRFVVGPDLRPISMHVESELPSGTTVATGAMDADGFTIAFERSGRSTTETLEPSASVPLLFRVVLPEWLAGLDPAVDVAAAAVIDEETGCADPIEARLLRRDAAGSEWIVETVGDPDRQTLALDADGKLVAGATEASRMRLVPCTAEEAADLTCLAVEYRVATFPVDPPIELPHRLERLVVELTWRDLEFADLNLEDSRQRLLSTREDGEVRSARVAIAAPFEDAASALDGAKRAAYLADTNDIVPTDPAIVAAATEATAGAADHAQAVAALSTWVFEFVEDGTIAETLSGPEVLARGVGKCTEYATLFASMARAHGIPTRIAVGGQLVGESYGGHMWNEVWLGRWVTVDSTVDDVGGSMTLLKLAHGDTLEGIGHSFASDLEEKLSIAVEEAVFRPSEVADAFETGIDGVTFTHVDYLARLSAPEPNWALDDNSKPWAVAIAFAPPGEREVALNFVTHAVPAGTPVARLAKGRLAHWQGRLEGAEVLQDEADEVRGVSARRTRVRGRHVDAEASRATVVTEVHWVRGPIAYRLTMNGWEAAQERRLDDFEALLSSFRFLDE